MTEGDIILARIPQADGGGKVRPTILLRKLPGFGDYLACGVSTQLKHEIKNFDLPLMESDEEFSATGLKQSSLARLSFLAVLTQSQLLGKIGCINHSALNTLRSRLADHMVK